MNTSDIRKTSYSALRGWGYTVKEAEHEGRVALFLLGKEVEYPKAFLARTLRNIELDKYKRAENRFEHVEIELSHEDKIDWFMDLIEPLPEESRELLTMVYYFGYTRKEIADYMNVAVGTVKSRLNRALGKLKDNGTKCS